MAGAIQGREAQNAQIAMLAAKRFPRDEKDAIDRILNSCSRESLAAVAIYQYSRGGTDIQGPSVRLAEAIAQHWGNIESGWREIERQKGHDGVGVSVIEAFAWDLQSNYRVPRVFTVRHWRDTKKGGYPLTDERDIYELCANQAARRVRACLLAVIPGDVVEEAQRQCDITLNAKADTSPEAQKKIVEAFGAVGVTRAQIEARIQRRMDAITPAQVVQLRKILASLKDGMSQPGDWFETAAKHAADETARAETPNPFAPPSAPAAKPKPAPKPEPVAGAEPELPMEPASKVQTIRCYFDRYETADSPENAKKPWRRYDLFFTVAGGPERKASTFSASVAEPLEWLSEGDEIVVEVEEEARGLKLLSVEKAQGGEA